MIVLGLSAGTNERSCGGFGSSYNSTAASHSNFETGKPHQQRNFANVALIPKFT
jgi:hypothetical protein